MVSKSQAEAKERGINMKYQIVKSISFMFLIHTLSAINMILCVNNCFSNMAWLILQLILSIAVIPIYFIVKGDPLSRWTYTLTSFIAHITFTVLFGLILGYIFIGWDDAIIYWTELFLTLAFGLAFSVDLIVNMKS